MRWFGVAVGVFMGVLGLISLTAPGVVERWEEHLQRTAESSDRWRGRESTRTRRIGLFTLAGGTAVVALGFALHAPHPPKHPVGHTQSELIAVGGAAMLLLLGIPFAVWPSWSGWSWTGTSKSPARYRIARNRRPPLRRQPDQAKLLRVIGIMMIIGAVILLGTALLDYLGIIDATR